MGFGEPSFVSSTLVQLCTNVPSHVTHDLERCNRTRAPKQPLSFTSLYRHSTGHIFIFSGVDNHWISNFFLSVRFGLEKIFSQLGFGRIQKQAPVFSHVSEFPECNPRFVSP